MRSFLVIVVAVLALLALTSASVVNERDVQASRSEIGSMAVRHAGCPCVPRKAKKAKKAKKKAKKDCKKADKSLGCHLEKCFTLKGACYECC